MKNFILKYSMAFGLLIFAVYNITERFIVIPDSIGLPVCILSIAFMMVGISYNGWCLGKGKSPWQKEKEKK